MGRPTKYEPKLVADICERLAKGEPLTVICRSEARFPDDGTVRAWGKANQSVAEAIARAREAGEDAIAMGTREIARGRGDTTDDVQRDKLIIDTDLKLLAKFNPNRWGDRSVVEHTGSINHVLSTNTEELEAELMALFDSGRLKLPGGAEIIEGDFEVVEEPETDGYEDIA